MKRIVICALALALLLSTVACGIPLKSDPEDGLDAHIAAVSEAGTKSLLILGDSIAAHYGVEEADSYEAKLTKKLSSGGEKWVSTNWGVSGDTTGDLVTLLGEKCADPKSRRILEEADLICISIGGNNILQFIRDAGYEGFPEATVPNLIKLLRSFEEQAEPMQTEFIADLEVIMRTIREVNPSAIVLVQNIYNVARDVEGDFSLVRPGATAATLIEPIFSPLRSALDENAERLGYTVADTFRAFAESSEPKLLRREMLHPNPKGHTLIADVLYETYLRAVDSEGAR